MCYRHKLQFRTSSVGMEVKREQRLGTTGCWEMTVSFMALRSWTNLHPCLWGFFTGRMGHYNDW